MQVQANIIYPFVLMPHSFSKGETRRVGTTLCRSVIPSKELNYITKQTLYMIVHPWGDISVINEIATSWPNP